MGLLSRMRAGLTILQPHQFKVATGQCPFCGVSLFVRLNSDDAGIRCVRCAASVVHLSLGRALHDVLPNVANLDAYELSGSGPLVEFLRRCARSIAVSEYLDDVPRGASCAGIRSEDVQNLTYADASFDLVTHTEIMEHVPDDARGFQELRRVLRPNGTMIFTVPLTADPRTQQRARLIDGEIVHLMPPAYHTDPLRGNNGVFVFREYGLDIVDIVKRAGFAHAEIVSPEAPADWIAFRRVIVARA